MSSGVLPSNEDLEQGQAHSKASARRSLASPIIYEYREIQPGYYEWHSPDDDDVNKEPKLSESVKARLFLFEGLPAKSSADDPLPWPQLPSWFFEGHEKEFVPNLSSQLERHNNSFFAKWLRYERQDSTHWKIERKINDATKRQVLAKDQTTARGDDNSTEQRSYRKWKNTSEQRQNTGQDIHKQGYSLDTVTDPMNLHLDHERYERWPRDYRPYHPIVITESEELGHAALECISLFWEQIDNGISTGCIVFDPTRKHLVSEKTYTFWGTEKDSGPIKILNCFIDDKATRGQFVTALKNYNKPASCFETPKSVILDIITRMILDDAVTVVSRLNEALDEIDISMADDEILRKSIHDWRNCFGRWRKAMLHEKVSLAYVRRLLGQHSTSSSPQLGAGNPSSPPSQYNFRDPFHLIDELEATQKRIDGTFQALMSTMSIIESQKAIAQAETVSKLTFLAFFFIPPTFVTGVFGMNVVEFAGQLKAWIWVACSLAVSIAAYVMLFWAEIKQGISKSPDIVTFNRYKVVRQLKTLYYYLKKAPAWIAWFIVFLGGPVGLGIGLWKLYISHLSKGAKAGITIAATQVPVIAAVVRMTLHRRQSQEGLHVRVT